MVNQTIACCRFAVVEISGGDRMSVGKDRRQFGRRETSLHAWIEIPGRARVPCIVRDLSVGGARLALDVPAWLPFTFSLTIEASRFRSMCEIRHQGRAQIGVRFIEAVAAPQEPDSRIADIRSADDTFTWMGR